jgi:hypothetical protein
VLFIYYSTGWPVTVTVIPVKRPATKSIIFQFNIIFLMCGDFMFCRILDMEEEFFVWEFLDLGFGDEEVFVKETLNKNLKPQETQYKKQENYELSSYSLALA